MVVLSNNISRIAGQTHVLAPAVSGEEWGSTPLLLEHRRGRTDDRRVPERHHDLLCYGERYLRDRFRVIETSS
ncbi:MAG: hypothetical protein IPP83_10270 [Flavobacteriales bacterium]|nr:hypothetical protein [Flavobacteriales bacterium]